MPEAPVRMSRNGLVVDGEGWFVVNAPRGARRDSIGAVARWRRIVVLGRIRQTES